MILLVELQQRRRHAAHLQGDVVEVGKGEDEMRAGDVPQALRHTLGDAATLELLDLFDTARDECRDNVRSFRLWPEDRPHTFRAPAPEATSL
ncbi:MAG: hypothetical protein HYZ58_09000 [Acidobacteria bacterium]|nr:hypothetical protein [Acidobacteriota bacterium]